MANKSKRKGTSWETAIVKFLEGFSLTAKRRPLAGAKDEGDIDVENNWWTVEAKATVRINIPQALRELRAEIENSGATHGVVWIKRPGKTSPGDGYVVMDGNMFVKLLSDMKEHNV